MVPNMITEKKKKTDFLSEFFFLFEKKNFCLIKILNTKELFLKTNLMIFLCYYEIMENRYNFIIVLYFSVSYWWHI